MKLGRLARSLPVFLFGGTDKFEDLDEAARRRIRAAQIGVVTQLVPLTMSVNILNAGIIVYVFWDTGSNVFLTVWAGLIAAVAGAAFWSWRRTRRNPPKGASLRAIKRSIFHAAVLGSVWGSAPFVLFPGSDTMHQLFLAATMAGMISGGAFCLSTVPAAGLAYTWTMVLASATALISAAYNVFIYTAIMLIIYAVFISRNLVAHGRLFFDHLRYQLKAEAQREVIGLLLNDFQEHASDWLWETNANGMLLHVSDRFAEAAGKPAAEIQGALLSDIFGGGQEMRPAELSDVLKRMTARAAFRDVTMPVRVGTDRRFWLLSAKPIFDSAGVFTGYHGVGADVTEKRLADEEGRYGAL